MHEKFHYNTLDEVRAKAEELRVTLPLSEDLPILGEPLNAAGLSFPNRLAIQPMEGCDGTADGAPGELTVRRYMRFAAGGAGLIWFEAVAVVPEGRANPRQLWLTRQNLDSFKRLIDDIREVSQRENGFAPPIIMQATHSGRYSKPHGKPEPMIACHNPVYEQNAPIGDSRIVSDEYLDALPEKYAESARLAREAGFDGVDVKACHRYLISELFSARTRENSGYGGDFENRIRLYRDAVSAARSAVSKGMAVTSRLNVYDGVPFPYGFGVSEAGGLSPELSEPIALVKKLESLGVRLIDITIGNPYVNPHVNRPFDQGPYAPPEHPFEGLGRMYSCVRSIKNACPGMTVVASGLSYARQFSPFIAAGLLRDGSADMAGFGREAFAYPNFSRDILRSVFRAEECCVACGKCSELMRANSTAGCVIRDKEVYLPIYN